MRLRHFAQTTATFALAVMLSAPALAGDHKHRHGDDRGHDMRPEWRGDRHQGFDRETWLDDCRERISYHRRDNGVGGAVIGGVAGGLLGNRIAGRGDRTVGTVAGAAVGAIAGAAIDRAEDRERDECEAWLDDYHAGGPGYGHPGYGYYGYAVPMIMVPVMIQPGKPCVETVTTTEYVTTRPARRYIPRRPRPDKRIRIVPDKRVPLK